ncbi:MAG: hypothetical protein JWQ79_3511 [Mucilaginibacter sp.]|nr:hypothetical protein [Mucilaginibacter sp.]
MSEYPIKHKLKIKYIICLALIFISLVVNAQESHVINGFVSNEKGEAISGATVFITNTKHVTTTNNEGKFVFHIASQSDYELVIKMLGFEPYIQNIAIHDKPVNISVRLKESNTILNTVNINAVTDDDRRKYLALFIKNFIGETDNAEKCKILNPEVLTFNYDKKSISIN